MEMNAPDNIASWQELRDFVEWGPNSRSHWSARKRMVLDVLSGLEQRGVAPFFRAGQSVTLVIFSTLDHHGLGAAPRVTLVFKPEHGLVRVAFGTENLLFEAPQSETTVPVNQAVPVIVQSLRRLWIETKPGRPVPSVLEVES
jgi:hypothetical protein